LVSVRLEGAAYITINLAYYLTFPTLCSMHPAHRYEEWERGSPRVPWSLGMID